MAPAALLEALLGVAERVGLTVRRAGGKGRLASAGGLCTINGQVLLLLNVRSSPIEQATILADAVGGRDLREIPMPDHAREFISARAGSRTRLLLPRRPPGPGLATCRAPGGRPQSREGR